MEQSVPSGKSKTIELELFVSGLTSKSIFAIATLKSICENNLAKNYRLKIIDIYKEPRLAKENDVFAVPTLIRRFPGPKKVFIGDLSNPLSVYRALGIERKASKNDQR
jgi:circadian clock protein KaiB